MIPLTQNTQSSQIHREIAQNGDCHGLLEEKVEHYCLMGRVLICESDKLLETDGGVVRKKCVWTY